VAVQHIKLFSTSSFFWFTLVFRLKRILFISTVLLLFTGYAFKNLGYWLSAPASAPIVADLIVVLGGDAGERNEKAVELYKAGFANKILITGMAGLSDKPANHEQQLRVNYLLNQGVKIEALIFDEQAQNTHEEASAIAALLKAQHWHSALIITDPPHLRRLNGALQPDFNKADLQYRLIQTKATNWDSKCWWQDKRWNQFCVMEVIKLVYYSMAYNN
jgi:uncharacterized SAM-binding protein YcdF (DUF218 family)